MQAVKESYLMNTYSHFPVKIVKGKGCYVWDDEGNKYLDFTSGIATCNLGHVPEPVKQALIEQLDNLWHCSNLYHIPSQEILASLLVENSCFDQVFSATVGLKQMKQRLNWHECMQINIKNQQILLHSPNHFMDEPWPH